MTGSSFARWEAASLGIFDRDYDGGAWFSWRTQAATLRAARSGGPLGQS